MKTTIICSSLLLGISILACGDLSKSSNESGTPEPTSSIEMSPTKNYNNMKSYLSIFEIPATDFTRAVDFYESILDVNVEAMEMQGLQMGIFPSEGQMVSGMVVKGEGYLPSADGVVIYLNGGENLQQILDKVEGHGGTVIVPKTLIDEENGYFAMFIDTEGNRLGLHSMN